MSIRIGTAGWSISRQVADKFPAIGTSLERYAGRFDSTEINSAFYRSHRAETWARWRDSVPEDFRFSVKIPKVITHQKSLVDCGEQLDRFLSQVSILGEKLAILLVQLPPKLIFAPTIAAAFFQDLKARSNVPTVCEPRHPSWFKSEANALFEAFSIARVAADPAVCAEAAIPGGWPRLRYWRLHGSPLIYRSSYRDRLHFYAQQLTNEAAAGAQSWCIFDNTASSAAAGDAIALLECFEGRAR